NAEAAKLSKNTSKAVMVLTIVERYTAKTAYLSGKINTIQLPDVRYLVAPRKNRDEVASTSVFSSMSRRYKPHIMRCGGRALSAIGRSSLDRINAL
ncbi:MAG: hypothetical protein H9847_08325, partial [Candidatus Anaerobiospirillum pullicola]|nr:hypothetical protein [Candidatus Anaerobiospirillum pullicola]